MLKTFIIFFLTAIYVIHLFAVVFIFDFGLYYFLFNFYCIFVWMDYDDRKSNERLERIRRQQYFVDF